jgi:lipoate-protein ligase A
MTSWRYLSDDGAGGAEGLALDEALMAAHARTAEPSPPALRLYTYASHAALCGRFQHLEAEIDIDACARTGTAYNRRPTGGGAIVMGEGQLGVAVAGRAPVDERPRSTLLRLSQGVVAGLSRLGIESSFGGKNDLKVDGRKIAGLGLYLDGHGGMLFHASVLADLDVAFMLEVLDIPAAKLGDRAVEAVEGRITTVSRELGGTWTGAMLREAVAVGFTEAVGIDLTESEPTPEEVSLTDALVRDKYSSGDWLFARTPQPDATATALLRTPAGLVRLYLALHGNTIKSALFTGDFNDIPPPIARFEGALKWARLARHDIETIAESAFANGTGLEVTPEEVVSTVLEAGGRARERTMVSIPGRDGSCYFPDGEEAT